MSKQLEKNFEHSMLEEKIYKKWYDNKYFSAKIDQTKKPYTIIMPPPNVTGQLHIGHALDSTVQDILIRTKRMQGFNTLWLPGTDHASISTETKIVDKLAEEGLSKEDIGRDEFLKRAWEWKEEFGGKITQQFKKLGASCDWDKERFTMDAGSSKAVIEIFKKLYEKGYIYKGEKLINWCPNCRTTISDAEVEHIECNDFIYYMKYKIKNTDEYVVFATTRPETLLGDTAIAVNPNDERYVHLVGKIAIVPIVDREIKIIADECVDIEFGTGVVKVTPAHDPNDFQIGERHKLEFINIMNDDGTMNSQAGKYEGLDRIEARNKIIQEFKQLGLFVKQDVVNHAVGVHERCNVRIEPLIKLQWFVKMEEMAKPAIEVYKSNQLKFIPDRFGKIYLHWLENIKDWCISRQLWWGHRIPAYYCKQCCHIEVAHSMPNNCPKCSCGSFTQDEDTLDTWFSSALWPFSTLGFIENSEDYKYFYPTDVLVTSYDIIFFWVVRMVFSGIEQTGKIPFKDVLIHGLVRDDKGRKMSKSLGNGIDPIDIIQKYGTDALRLTLITGNAAGNDLRFSYEKIETNRNFLNKVWNAAKFLLLNIKDKSPVVSIDELTGPDKWIISKINSLVKEVTYNIENYDLGIAVQKVHFFVWDEFCDWYIEMVKPRLYNEEDNTRNAALYTLKEVLIKSLKLLHPFIPFITEEIFTKVQDEEKTIMLSKWPQYDENLNFESDETDINIIKDAVKKIRNIRSNMKVLPSKKTKITLVCEDEHIINIFEKGESFFKSLAYANELVILNGKQNTEDNEVPIVIQNAIMYIPFSQLVDVEKEIQRLEAERDKLAGQVEHIVKKLANEGFINKAPQKVVLEEREKMKKYKAMFDNVVQQLNNLY